ncbi:MAG TPA: hypothetical protein VF943_09930 [Burkholderiales bacterium]
MAATEPHSPAKVSPPSAADDEDPHVGVACWMRELGTRSTTSLESTLPPVRITQRVGTTPFRISGRVLREALVLAALVAAYLQYDLLGKLLQIALIHSIIVFVFPGPV